MKCRKNISFRSVGYLSQLNLFSSLNDSRVKVFINCVNGYLKNQTICKAGQLTFKFSVLWKYVTTFYMFSDL